MKPSGEYSRMEVAARVSFDWSISGPERRKAIILNDVGSMTKLEIRPRGWAV